MQARAMLDSKLSEEGMVNQEFEELYPGKVQRTQIAYNSKVVLVEACGMLCEVVMTDKLSAATAKHRCLYNSTIVVIYNYFQNSISAVV